MAVVAGTLEKGRRMFPKKKASAADTPTTAHVLGVDSVSPLTAPKMHFRYSSGDQPLPRYTIRRGVGMGGFGEVYFAVSEAGKEVALKRVQRNLDIELRGVSHCLNLKHPNLISIYDICRDDQDQAWVIMEYVAGPNLREVLDRHPQGLPLEEAVRCMRGVAAGVAHLHDSGLVHRDLKPGNIFDDVGIIKIGDYGLSKFISSSRRGGHTESVGTFHYMAPEIGRGEYGREIDIYAMGVIFCELLTGRVPFDGESGHEIVMKHLTAMPDLTGLESPYRDVIASALEKDPARRPQSVAEMVRPLGIEIDDYGIARPSAFPKSKQPDAPEPPIKAKVVGTKPAATACAAVPLPVAEAIPAKSTYEEPLARAIRGSLQDMARWWKSLEQFPGTRVAVMIGFIALIVVNTGWLLPLLSMLAVVYVPYYLIRQMALSTKPQPSYAEARQQAVAVAAPPRPKPLSAQQWRARQRKQLAAKRSLQRASELGGSATLAGILTVIFMVIAGLVELKDTSISATEVAPLVASGAAVMVGALMLLFLGKFWERREGDSVLRRLVLGGVGAIVGGFVYQISNFLMLPVEANMTLLTTMGHYALVMGAVGWWKNTDPLRRRRLSLWSVFVAVALEWVVSQFLPTPQPWSMIMVGCLAIVVQLTATWENPSEYAEEVA